MATLQKELELQRRCKEIDKRVSELDQESSEQFLVTIQTLTKYSNQLRYSRQAQGDLVITSDRPFHREMIKDRNRSFLYVFLSSIGVLVALWCFDGIWGSFTFEQAFSVAAVVCLFGFNGVRQEAKIDLVSLSLSRFELQDKIDALEATVRGIFNTNPAELNFDAYGAETAWKEASSKSWDDGPLFSVISHAQSLEMYLNLKERLLNEFFDVSKTVLVDDTTK